MSDQATPSSSQATPPPASGELRALLGERSGRPVLTFVDTEGHVMAWLNAYTGLASPMSGLTPNTLVWADETGLWAMDGAGGAAFGISGKDGKSWGGLTLDRGDVLTGNENGYQKWDASAGTIETFGVLKGTSGYFGSATNGVQIDADGLAVVGTGRIVAGPVTLDGTGVALAVSTSEDLSKAYRLTYGGAVVGGLFAYKDPTVRATSVTTESEASYNSFTSLRAYSPSGYYAQAELRVKESTTINRAFLVSATGALTGTAEFIVDAALRHVGSRVGFYNALPITKPTVTGSRGGNAALQAGLQALEDLGLIIDNSSA